MASFSAFERGVVGHNDKTSNNEGEKGLSSGLSTRSQSPFEGSVAVEACGEASVRSTHQPEPPSPYVRLEAPQSRIKSVTELTAGFGHKAMIRWQNSLKVAFVDIAQSCRNFPEAVTKRVLQLESRLALHTSKLRHLIGIHGLVLLMHIALGVLSVLFSAICCWLLNFVPSPREAAVGILTTPVSGLVLGVGSYAIQALQVKASAPFGAPLSLLTFCIPVIALGRAATRAALAFVRDATVGLRFERAVQYSPLDRTVNAAVDRFSASLCKADIWQNWILSTQEFFGPADVSAEPSPIKLAFYVQPETAFHGGFFHLLSHSTVPCSNPLDRLRSNGIMEDSANLSDQTAIPTQSPLEAESFIALEAAELIPDFCSSETIALAEPSLRWAAAASTRAATGILQIVDGSLTLISIGVLALLSGDRVAAGLLLSRSAVYAFTCAASAFTTEASRVFLARLMRKAEELEGQTVDDFGAPKWKEMQEAMLESDALKLDCQPQEMQHSEEWSKDMTQTQRGNKDDKDGNEPAARTHKTGHTSRWFTSPFSSFRVTRSTERENAEELQGRHSAVEEGLSRVRAARYSGLDPTDADAECHDVDEGDGPHFQTSKQ